MSNEVTKWDEELAKHAKVAAAIETPQTARISIRGGVMTYMDQRIADNKMAVIILATVVEHAWYSKRFDPLKPDAPDCFAFSEDGEDMAPHEKSFKKQSEACSDCALFQWGSDSNSPSGKGKACKQKRKLLVMPASVLNAAGGVKSAELALLDVPVTSVKRWANYVNMVASTEQRPPWGVVSEIKVGPDPRTQLRVDFTHLFNIGDEHLADIVSRLNVAKDILFTPYEKTAEGLSPATAAMQTGRKY